MKKEYQKPTMNVVKIQQYSIICTSPLTSVGTNLGTDNISYGGGSNQAARVKQNSYNVWDDDWAE